MGLGNKAYHEESVDMLTGGQPLFGNCSLERFTFVFERFKQAKESSQRVPSCTASIHIRYVLRE